MTRGTSLRLGLSHLTRKPPQTSARRLIHSSPSCAFAVTLSNVLDPPSTHAQSTRDVHRTPLRNPQEKVQEGLFEQLELELSGSKPACDRVWGTYMDLLQTVGARHIPLEVHKRVLRACTPSTEELRVSTALRLRSTTAPLTSTQWGGRLETVINGIEAAGQKPTLEDYHVLLAHFAAVGDHTGAVQLYKGLMEKGFEPEPKTYGLILQATAHRLTLPCTPAQQPKYVRQATAVCRDVLTEMWGRGITVSSVNLDLAMRILKESADGEAFAQFMRVGYGIDLDYPDRSPVEVLERQAVIPEAAEAVVEKSVSEPQPFSTAALNTTIDTLGRLGNVSKLVQTFEVLTKPLPLEANQHFSHTFDEEDDDFGIANPASTPVYQAPHAKPNTTTYNLLIKHIARAGHGALARHYLQEAMVLDRVTDTANRAKMRLLPEPVPAPHFAVNKGTILPVFGLANRDKDITLMRWVSWVTRHTLRRKEHDLAFYTSIARGLESRKVARAVYVSDSPVASTSHEPLPPPTVAASQAVPTVDEAEAIFAVDLDAPFTPSPPPVKFLDLSLHLRLLQRDINQLNPLHQDIEEIVARTVQRVKERLGRRVWGAKNVYLLHSGQREVLPRPAWSELVHYKNMKPDDEPPRNRRRRTRTQAHPTTSFSTSASVDRA
ncbi:hypothetical protein FIBSPDRAFT_821982 [Athelia psychrophila]|uniref:Uncharacterized protein n=1 Tax=Athelia psychrophila TaxID=1759441 RepID=A0A166N591_9AGAM|nr:hypothetical protein FIBSPDRAFT_821982 [Fibularhizoctonia sp. CBS 109695]